MLGCHYDFKLHVPEGGELNNNEQGSSFGIIFLLFLVTVAGTMLIVARGNTDPLAFISVLLFHY